MNSLEGTYKSKFDNFSLKIVCNNPDLTDQFTFIKIDANSNESKLFERVLESGHKGTMYIWGTGLGINYNTDFTWISIVETPVIGLIGDYVRI
jgi:hypothetical protein